MFSILDKLKELNISNTAGEDIYRTQIVKHRRDVFTRIAAVVVFVIVVILATLISVYNRVYADYTVVAENDRIDSDDAKYIAYNGNVIKYSQDGAEAFDGKNNLLWNITFEMQKPKVVTCGDYAALGDFKGNKIYVISTSGVQNEIDMKLPVSNFCVSGQGIVAAVLEDDSETKINLYAPTGELLASMKCTMTKSGYPIDLSLSADGMKLGVAYMRIENGDMKSSVAFYNFDDVGQNEIDNYVSGYDYIDTIVPKVKFINNDTAFALGDNRLIIYKGSQKPVSKYETFLSDEVKSVYYGKNNIALVFRDTENAGNNRINVYDDKGNLEFTDSIGLEYTDIVVKDDYIIAYNDTECYMCCYNGKVKYDNTFADPVLLLVPDKRMTKWTLVSRDQVQLVTLN